MAKDNLRNRVYDLLYATLTPPEAGHLYDELMKMLAEEGVYVDKKENKKSKR